MTRHDLFDCMLIINYGILPGDGGGWADLPVGVGTWLFPTQLCLNKISEEQANKKAG
jgi:hypothetical protein